MGALLPEKQIHGHDTSIMTSWVRNRNRYVCDGLQISVDVLAVCSYCDYAQLFCVVFSLVSHLFWLGPTHSFKNIWLIFVVLNVNHAQTDNWLSQFKANTAHSRNRY